jgi:hypothetical protein
LEVFEIYVLQHKCRQVRGRVVTLRKPRIYVTA